MTKEFYTKVEQMRKKSEIKNFFDPNRANVFHYALYLAIAIFAHILINLHLLFELLILHISSSYI